MSLGPGLSLQAKRAAEGFCGFRGVLGWIGRLGSTFGSGLRFEWPGHTGGLLGPLGLLFGLHCKARHPLRPEGSSSLVFAKVTMADKSGGSTASSPMKKPGMGILVSCIFLHRHTASPLKLRVNLWRSLMSRVLEALGHDASCSCSILLVFLCIPSQPWCASGAHLLPASAD